MTTLRWLLLHVIQFSWQVGSSLYRRSRLSTRKPSWTPGPAEVSKRRHPNTRKSAAFTSYYASLLAPSLMTRAGGRHASAVRDRIDPGGGFRCRKPTSDIARSSEPFFSNSRRRRGG